MNRVWEPSRTSDKKGYRMVSWFRKRTGWKILRFQGKLEGLIQRHGHEWVPRWCSGLALVLSRWRLGFDSQPGNQPKKQKQIYKINKDMDSFPMEVSWRWWLLFKIGVFEKGADRCKRSHLWNSFLRIDHSCSLAHQGKILPPVNQISNISRVPRAMRTANYEKNLLGKGDVFVPYFIGLTFLGIKQSIPTSTCLILLNTDLYYVFGFTY